MAGGEFGQAKIENSHVAFSERVMNSIDCPPCFNCNLDQFPCLNAGICNSGTGICSCPPGYGGQNCLDPCNQPFLI